LASQFRMHNEKRRQRQAQARVIMVGQAGDQVQVADGLRRRPGVTRRKEAYAASAQRGYQRLVLEMTWVHNAIIAESETNAKAIPHDHVIHRLIDKHPT